MEIFGGQRSSDHLDFHRQFNKLKRCAFNFSSKPLYNDRCASSVVVRCSCTFTANCMMRSAKYVYVFGCWHITIFVLYINMREEEKE